MNFLGPHSTRPPPISRASLTGMLLTLLLTALLAVHFLTLMPVYIDDAYITFRFSQNLAAGAGLTWTPGETPIEGFSNPIWVVLVAVGIAVGVDPVTWSFWLSVGCIGTMGVLLCSFRTRKSDLASCLCISSALLVALNPVLQASYLMGLETGMFAFSILFGFVEAHRQPSRKGVTPRSAFALFLLVMTRFEGLAFALWLAICLDLRRARPWRPLHLSLCIVLVGTLTALRRAYFGEWLPLTVQAKGGSAAGLVAGDVDALVAKMAGAYSYITDFIDQRLLLLIVIYGLALLVLSRREPILAALSAGTVSGGVAIVLLNGGDWMPGFRLLSVFLPMMVATVLVASQRAKEPAQTAIAATLLGSLLIAAIPAASQPRGTPSLVKESDHRWNDVGLWMEHVATSETNALIEQIGRIGFYAPTVKITDFQGLVNPHVAKHGAGSSMYGKRMDAYSLSRAPEIIQSNSLKTYLNAMRFISDKGWADRYKAVISDVWWGTYILVKEDLWRDERFFLPTHARMVDLAEAEITAPVRP